MMNDNKVGKDCLHYSLEFNYVQYGLLMFIIVLFGANRRWMGVIGINGCNERAGTNNITELVQWGS